MIYVYVAVGLVTVGLEKLLNVSAMTLRRFNHWLKIKISETDKYKQIVAENDAKIIAAIEKRKKDSLSGYTEV